MLTEHTKFLRFVFQGTLYEFTCLPNGLASAPRVFTKLMKPVFSSFRAHGIFLVAYIDDIILIADTEEELPFALTKTVTIINWFGFHYKLWQVFSCPFTGSVFFRLPDKFHHHASYYDPFQRDKTGPSLPNFKKQTVSHYKEVASWGISLMVANLKHGPLFYRGQLYKTLNYDLTSHRVVNF